jgi:hypothetical protein
MKSPHSFDDSRDDDAALRELLCTCAARESIIADDGFSARVLAAMPPPIDLAAVRVLERGSTR